MTETIKTTTALLTELSDGAAAHSTNREKLRNGIVSFDVTRSAQVNPKDAPYLAVGDGVANDTTPLASTATAGAGKRIIIPPASFLVTAATAVPANTSVYGGGRGSLIKTATVSTHLITVATAGAVLRALALQGVKGTTESNNSAVLFTGATDGLVEDCEAFGMSGMGLLALGSDYIRFVKNYVHGLTGDASYSNTCDLAFYTGASYGLAAFNRLAGGAQTELAILLQLNSTKHLIIGNTGKGHYSYGLIDYDTTPRSTWSIIVVNRFEDIDGAGGGGTKGAGIYCTSTGGQIIGLNQLANTNINTTTENLAPGAIGLSAIFSPLVAIANMINVPNWYGIKVVSSTTSIVDLVANHVFEAKKAAFRVHSASHVSILGGSATMLTATPLTQTAVQLNTTDVAPFTNVSAIALRIRGSFRGFDTNFTDNLTLALNQVSEVNGISAKVANGVGAIVSGNNFDSTTAGSSTALDITAMTYSVFSHNVFRSTHTTCIQIAGTCTGSIFDETNILVGKNMNHINNNAPGMIVRQYGTAAPTLLVHQVGDEVINRAPAVGQPKGWLCTVAGTPGTWVSEGNL